MGDLVKVEITAFDGELLKGVNKLNRKEKIMIEREKLPKEVTEIIDIIEEKKGQEIKVYDMAGKSLFFDYSILCTGSSSRNIDAIATDLKKSMDNVRSVEGLEECNWVLIDGGVIVSVFSKEAREYYQLDAFMKILIRMWILNKIFLNRGK